MKLDALPRASVTQLDHCCSPNLSLCFVEKSAAEDKASAANAQKKIKPNDASEQDRPEQYENGSRSTATPNMFLAPLGHPSPTESEQTSPNVAENVKTD